MPRKHKNVPIIIPAGTHPSPDTTPSSTILATDTDKVRFTSDKWRSIGGWTPSQIDGGKTLDGCVRTIFSYFFSSKNRFLLGSHTKLFEYINSTLVNITPLDEVTNGIADSLDTNFFALGADPLATTISSTTVVVTNASHVNEINDPVTLAGATGGNGIPLGEINAEVIVTAIVAGVSWSFRTPTAATSTGSTGGGSVTEATKVITVNATGHGQLDGDRTEITLATGPFGGIPASDINKEHILRNPVTNAFDIVVATTATSSVAAQGGAATLFQKEIDDGFCDFDFGFGYGGGLYGAGLYGVGKDFTNVFRFPRVYSMARFGDFVGLSPGQQTGAYKYDNVNDVAPTLITGSGAPATVNWVFESNNQFCTLGADGVGNRFKTSKTGNMEDFVISATSDAFQDDIEGAEDFVSQIQVRGVDLLFSQNQVWEARFLGLPQVWTFKKSGATDGIIGPNARVEVGGIAYWMGKNDFYAWDGGSSRPIEGNTVKRFIYENINLNQSWKCFAWVNRKFNEIWWHWPKGASLEPTDYVIFNYLEGHWTIGTIDRLAAEAPIHLLDMPLLVDSANNLFKHESGVNDGANPLNPFIETNESQLGNGDETMYIMEMLHDAIQTGNFQFQITTKLRQQDANPRTFGPFTVTATTQATQFRAHGRLQQFRFFQDALNESFVIGQIYESLQQGTTR